MAIEDLSDPRRGWLSALFGEARATGAVRSFSTRAVMAASTALGRAVYFIGDIGATRQRIYRITAPGA